MHVSNFLSCFCSYQAEIEGPVGTPYEGKFFHLKLIFCQQFPAAPPRGFFTTKIYHPNVDNTTGAICVNTLKKDWTPSTTLSHVLNVIRCLLIVPFPESSLNDEAGKLFMESYEEYSKRARLMADVHGRKASFATENSTSNNNSRPGSLGLDPRILKTSSSDNPLRINNNISTNSSNETSAQKNNTATKPSSSSSSGAKKVTTKKNKSLKRL